MTDEQAESLSWLAFVNAESRRDGAPTRDVERLWRRRLLRAIGLVGRVSYRFEIATEPKTGADLASSGEHHARSLKSCAARKLARVLIDAGMPDGPIEAWREGVLCYTVRSLAAYSRTTLTENPRPRAIPYRENPHATREPARGTEETP